MENGPSLRDILKKILAVTLMSPVEQEQLIEDDRRYMGGAKPVKVLRRESVQAVLERRTAWMRRGFKEHPVLIPQDMDRAGIAENLRRLMWKERPVNTVAEVHRQVGASRTDIAKNRFKSPSIAMNV